jgi:hypothetical protein
MKHLFAIVLLLAFSFASLYTPSPASALEGTAGGPCMPSHDTPTIGSYRNGDGNRQTYTNPNGIKITRICAATKWSNGKIDHLSHYANYSDECYQISGLGTSTVTVKRVSETYAVPAWQTGSEAGKCQPLDHLDIFLAASSAPTPTPSPTPTTTSTTSTTQTTTTTTTDTATPTPSPTSTSSPSTTQKNTTQKQTPDSTPSTQATQPQVLGATQEETTSTATPSGAPDTTINSTNETSSWVDTFRTWWWLLLILLIIGLLGWYVSRPAKPTN